MTDTDDFRAATNLSSEIGSLKALHGEVKAAKWDNPGVRGTVQGWRTNGLPVYMPKAVALRVLSAEIARKEATLLDLKKKLLGK